MKTGTYIGPLQHLQGKTALIRVATHEHVVAQFDDKQLSKQPNVRYSFCANSDERDAPYDALGFGWHAFPQEHFRVDP